MTDPARQGDTFDPKRLRWITHLTDLKQVLLAIEGASEVVIDLETTGLNEHETGSPEWPCPARIALASLTLPQRAAPYSEDPLTYIVPLSHPDGPLSGHWRAATKLMAEAMQRTGVPITNHNLKFDARWIYAHTGIDLSEQIAWDTQIAAHLMDETTSTKLKERVPATFGVERWDDFDLSTPGAAEQVPLIDLGMYAARDTYWTWRLAVLQRTILGVGAEGENADPPESPDEVEERRLGTLAAWCAMPMVSTLTSIEQRGIRLNVPWTTTMISHLQEQAEQAREDLLNLVPGPQDDRVPSFAPTSLWFRAWTEQAVEQGDLVIGAMTPNGAPSWGKAVLIRQARAGSKVAQRLLDYRKATKALEFLNVWLKSVAPDGRIHATYNAGRVVTGRLSSDSPNMQQVAKALRPAFIPSEGYLIAELDYSQIELRAAAFIARCEPMLQAFRDGADLHRLIASTITGKPPEEVTTDERQAGKAANFGFLYGQEAEGFREYAETNYGVTFTPMQAVAVRQAFFDRWDGMAQWHERVVRRAAQDGQVTSPLGRVRRVPDIWSDRLYESSSAERKAINAPVQGFASDLMQIAAASIAGRLPGYEAVPGARIVATVHDSIVVEVPEDDWKRTTGRCMRRMIDLDPVLAAMGCHLDVPLAVEASVGTKWGLADIGVIH